MLLQECYAVCIYLYIYTFLKPPTYLNQPISCEELLDFLSALHCGRLLASINTANIVAYSILTALGMLCFLVNTMHNQDSRYYGFRTQTVCFCVFCIFLWDFVRINNITIIILQNSPNEIFRHVGGIQSFISVCVGLMFV